MSRYSIPDAGNEDLSGAAHTASQYAGDAGQPDFFGNVLGSVMGRQQHIANDHLDEQRQEHLVQQHQALFGGGGGGGGNAQFGNSSLGGAAAMQALKMFTGGQQMSQAGSGGGGAQNAFVGMAMGEAAKLFDSQRAQGATDPSATKEQTVQHAAETALKMFMQSQGGSGGLGGGSGLMGLASKFL